MEENSVGRTKLELAKDHVVKHKIKYIAGGSLLLGVGLGFFLRNRLARRNDVEFKVDNIKLEGIDFREANAKIIGSFSEIDGEEYNNLQELINAKELIGSTSADVGFVELYYDANGNTYAVARDYEDYYGKKTK